MTNQSVSWRQRLFTLGLYLGLMLGVIYAFGGLLIDLATIGLNWGTLMAFGALVGMPAIFAASGFVLGVLLDSLQKLLLSKG